MASGACATSPPEWLRKNRNLTRLRLTIGCYRDETKYRWGKVHVLSVLLSIDYGSWLNPLQLKAFSCRVTSYGRQHQTVATAAAARKHDHIICFQFHHPY
jgi:predicted YcjX-like family ATPase